MCEGEFKEALGKLVWWDMLWGSFRMLSAKGADVAVSESQSKVFARACDAPSSGSSSTRVCAMRLSGRWEAVRARFGQADVTQLVLRSTSSKI